MCVSTGQTSTAIRTSRAAFASLRRRNDEGSAKAPTTPDSPADAEMGTGASDGDDVMEEFLVVHGGTTEGGYRGTVRPLCF